MFKRFWYRINAACASAHRRLFFVPRLESLDFTPDAVDLHWHWCENGSHTFKSKDPVSNQCAEHPGAFPLWGASEGIPERPPARHKRNPYADFTS
jgi:hypothetical protein